MKYVTWSGQLFNVLLFTKIYKNKDTITCFVHSYQLCYVQGSQNVSEEKANHQEEAAGEDINKRARALKARAS